MSSEGNRSKSIPNVWHAACFHVLQAEGVAKFVVLKRQLAYSRRFQKHWSCGVRQSSLFLQRLNWESFVAVNGNTPTFHRHIRMDHESFNILLGFVCQRISVNYGIAKICSGAIIQEIWLYSVLGWFAGGSYTDILYFCGISKTCFYTILWSSIDALLQAPELHIHFPTTVDKCLDAASGFWSLSSREVVDICVCAVDGHHLQIHVPSKTEALNVRSFYSGLYSTWMSRVPVIITCWEVGAQRLFNLSHKNDAKRGVGQARS